MASITTWGRATGTLLQRLDIAPAFYPQYLQLCVLNGQPCALLQHRIRSDRSGPLASHGRGCFPWTTDEEVGGEWFLRWNPVTDAPLIATKLRDRFDAFGALDLVGGRILVRGWERSPPILNVWNEEGSTFEEVYSCGFSSGQAPMRFFAASRSTLLLDMAPFFCGVDMSSEEHSIEVFGEIRDFGLEFDPAEMDELGLPYDKWKLHAVLWTSEDEEVRGVDIDDALVAGVFDPAEIERRTREYEAIFGSDDSDGEEGEPSPSILRVWDRSVMPRAAETDSRGMPRAAETDSAVRDDDEDDDDNDDKDEDKGDDKGDDEEAEQGGGAGAGGAGGRGGGRR